MACNSIKGIIKTEPSILDIVKSDGMFLKEAIQKKVRKLDDENPNP